MSLTVDPLPGLEVDENTPLSKNVCVCPDTSPVHYEVRVKVSEQAKIGDLNVTVTATNSDDATVCADKQVENVPSRDKITRALKVLPEGTDLI